MSWCMIGVLFIFSTIIVDGQSQPNNKPNLLKCCSFGKAYLGVRCKKSSFPFEPQIYDVDKKFNKSSNDLFNFTPKNVVCKGEGIYRFMMENSSELFLQVDGRLRIAFSQKNIVHYNPGEYCLDIRYTNISDNKPSLIANICSAKDKGTENRTRVTLNNICMVISCFFILLTVTIYATNRELQHGVHYMVLIACLLSFFVAFMTMVMLQSFIYYCVYNLIPINVIFCKISTFTFYFSTLAGFFWMNVMCFDIWRTFNSNKITLENHADSLISFGKYCVHGFGVPAAMTIILMVLTYSGLPKHDLLPNIDDPKIYFLQDNTKLIYLYIPIALLCVVNLIFFVLTAIKIEEVKRNLQPTLSSKDSNTHNTEKRRFYLYIKMFIIMGPIWILEVISCYVSHDHVLWWISDAYNCLFGFFIFISKGNVRNKICGKKNNRNSNTTQAVINRNLWRNDTNARTSTDTVQTTATDSSIKSKDLGIGPLRRMSQSWTQSTANYATHNTQQEDLNLSVRIVNGNP